MIEKVFLNLGILHVLLLLSISAAHSQDALMVHSRDVACRVSTASLDNIQRITFSDNDLSIKPFSGDITVYALDDIAKITFGDAGTGVTTLPTIGLDVVVYVTPAGEIVVESPVAVQLLTLFNVDGKMLRVAAVETRHATSLQTTLNASTLPAGIYLLQIKTQQGVVAKKIIKK